MGEAFTRLYRFPKQEQVRDESSLELTLEQIEAHRKEIEDMLGHIVAVEPQRKMVRITTDKGRVVEAYCSKTITETLVFWLEDNKPIEVPGAWPGDRIPPDYM